MMYQQVIARRYAKGLMMAAVTEEFAVIEDEFSQLYNIMQQEASGLAHLFNDPAFLPSEKKAVIDQLFARYELNEVLRYFLSLLVDKGRLTLLPLIYEAFVALLDDYYGRLRAHIKSAAPVSEPMVLEITAALKKICKKEILADVALDKSLLAGIRVEIGGMVIDGSAQAKLVAMKNRLVSSIEAV